MDLEPAQVLDALVAVLAWADQSQRRPVSTVESLILEAVGDEYVGRQRVVEMDAAPVPVEPDRHQPLCLWDRSVRRDDDLAPQVDE